MKPKAARAVFALLVSMAMALFSQVALRAQEARGTITGSVVDINKAAIPGASVKITNVAMNTSVTVQTNESGLFQAPYLLPGTYQIVVEATGFKKYVRDGIVLRINDRIDVPIELEVGAVDQTVTVTADAPALETTSGSMGQVVDQRRVAELPLVHGDPYTLMGLSTGVAFTRDPRLDRPFEPTHIVGYTVDGTRANRSDLMIDGIPSTATANANEVIASYVPPTDIIQEFKVQTATFDSQFGNTEGGVTSISIRSGTNELHGSAYYWKEPGSLAANDFFGNSRGQPRPESFSNRYGTTVTGPVFLPKLYNGRDRTFFTFGWEGIRDARPRYDSTTPSVPTEAMRNGDFSALLALGPQYQIYNPFTRRPDPARPGHYIQDPFPNNIIPPELINPVAKSLLQYIGKPLTAGTREFLNNNLDSTLQERTKKYDNFTFRIDQVLGEKNRLFVRGSLYDRDSFYNDYFHTIATGTSFQFISRQGVIDDVYTINPTTVLNVRYGYNRFIRAQDINPAGWGFDLTSVGFPASYNAAIPEDIRRFPRLDFPSGTYQGTGQTGEFRPNDIHSVSATLNKTANTHSLKFGVEFRAYRENDFFTSNNQTGQFVFDNTYTRRADDTPGNQTTQVGLSFAAFLLGIPTSGGVVRAADYAEQSTTWGFFVQDDWKVSPKLILNLGLRYEFETPLTERYNRSVTGFDFNYIQPIEAAARAAFAASQTGSTATPEVPVSQFNVRGGLQFASAGHRGLYSTPKANFMPRIGFAYQLDERTVVRGGYGIFYGFLGQRRGDVIQSGFSATTNFVPTNNDIDPVTGRVIYIATLSNPFPNGIQEPIGTALGPQTFLGQSITFFNQNPDTSYMQRWELGVQRELPGGIVVEAAYVGNRGTHIEITRNLNALPYKYLIPNPLQNAARISYLSAQVPNPFRNLTPSGATINGASATITRDRLLRPFPEFGDVNTTNNDGYSWYHSGQFRVEKRFSKGYTVQMSYTWSKFMQATEYLNPSDPLPTEMISDMDTPHRLSVSGIVELPFGRGRYFLSEANGLLDRIIGGWQAQGVYQYQSGLPVNFTTNLLYTGDGNIALDNPTPQKWFNTAGFVALSGTQSAYTLRTFPLRFSAVRASPLNNFDLSVIKNVPINERMRVQFRGEFINAFNHPFFGQPAVNPGNASTFGQLNSANQANYPRRVQLGLKFLF
jgi:hypothetical protein